MSYKYTQCLLEDQNGSREVAWIPNNKARKGKVIYLKVLQEHRKVIEVWDRTERDMAEHQMDYDKFKRQTDI